MSPVVVLLPVFVQVGLTFFLLFWLGKVRFDALKAGSVRLADVALGERKWPVKALQIENAFANQFQMPVLFYVLVGFALATAKADALFVLMSWAFVGARLVHAFIHTGSNDVQQRFRPYLAGSLILLGMWLILAARLLSA